MHYTLNINIMFKARNFIDISLLAPKRRWNKGMTLENHTCFDHAKFMSGTNFLYNEQQRLVHVCWAFCQILMNINVTFYWTHLPPTPAKIWNEVKCLTMKSLYGPDWWNLGMIFNQSNVKRMSYEAIYIVHTPKCGIFGWRSYEVKCVIFVPINMP